MPCPPSSSAIIYNLLLDFFCKKRDVVVKVELEPTTATKTINDIGCLLVRQCELYSNTFLLYYFPSTSAHWLGLHLVLWLGIFPTISPMLKIFTENGEKVFFCTFYIFYMNISMQFTTCYCKIAMWPMGNERKLVF